jgi:putative tricarboxylic transport membrane protein
MHNIEPGPLMLQQRPDMFWGIITSMYVGNAMLLALNLPLIGLWVKLLKIPFNRLFVLILILCIIGVYSLDTSTFDIGIMIVFGVVGYLMRKVGLEAPPLVLAFILGPRLEQGLRQSLLISQGSLGIFFSRPIAIGCLLAVAALIVLGIFNYISKKREEIFQDD